MLKVPVGNPQPKKIHAVTLFLLRQARRFVQNLLTTEGTETHGIGNMLICQQSYAIRRQWLGIKSVLAIAHYSDATAIAMPSSKSNFLAWTFSVLFCAFRGSKISGYGELVIACYTLRQAPRIEFGWLSHRRFGTRAL
jgi:hypothetical protein